MPNPCTTIDRLLTLELVVNADMKSFYPNLKHRRAQQHSPARPIMCWISSGPVYAHPGRLPFADESFDEVRCIDQLEFVMREEDLLREIARVLAPGGRFTLRVPAAGWLAGFDSFNLSRYVRDITRYGYGAPEPTEIGWRKHYPIADLEMMMSKVGLMVASAERSRFIFAELASLVVLLRHFWWGYDPTAYERGRQHLAPLRHLEDRIHVPGGFLVTIVAVKPRA